MRRTQQWCEHTPLAAVARALAARTGAAVLRQLTVVSSQDALFKGLQGKLPKGVAACVAVLLQAVRFGARDGPGLCGSLLACPDTAGALPQTFLRIQVVWRARHQAVSGAQSLQPAAGPQGQERARWRQGAGGALSSSPFSSSLLCAAHFFCGSTDACPLFAHQVELTRWLGAAAVKRDFTDKMRDAQKKEVRSTGHHLPPEPSLNHVSARCAAGRRSARGRGGRRTSYADALPAQRPAAQPSRGCCKGRGAYFQLGGANELSVPSSQSF